MLNNPNHPTDSMPLSVVIPCFNEQDNMRILHRRVSDVCASLGKESYELILVNDGSSDQTWSIINLLCEEDDRVMGVDLSRNYGHQIALSAGLSLATGDRILILDADLQDPPELLPDMMRLMDNGADVVYGRRIERQGETRFKKLSAKIFYRLLNALSDVPIPVDTGDFRLLTRQVLDVILQMPEQSRFLRGMVSWVGFNQVALEYERQERHAGTTHYTFRKMIALATDAILSFSIRPLRLTMHLSVISGALGLTLVFYVLASWVLGYVVPGWASTAVFILVLGGIQLLCLGILGEYVGRIYGEVKRRPLFVIRQIRTKRNASGRVPTNAIPSHSHGGRLSDAQAQ